MKEEIRTKTVEYKVYIAKDGEEFNTKKECTHHEKILDGTRVVCPECHGNGTVPVKEEWENYHTGATERWTFHKTCPECHGKGYLDKKIKIEEVWE